jgi:hypothetical protein
MIGERLESRLGPPWAALVFLAVGFCLVAAGLISGIHALAIGAVLPVAIFGSFWLLGQERPLSARLLDQGLEIENAGQPTLIPYASIQNIRVGSRPTDPAVFRKSSCAMAVLHEGGLLRIPSRLNFPSHEVYRFLCERVPGCGGRDINPVVKDYLDCQLRQFGAERVATFRAGRRLPSGPRRDFGAFWIGLIVAGSVWMALGFSGVSDTAWSVVGFLCTVTGVLFYLFGFLSRGLRATPLLKNWKEASLVIGPEGMAMVQGEIQGEIGWPEVLDVRFNAKPRSFQFGHGPALLPGILVSVKGAKILVADIYDRPLHVVFERIMAASGRSTE